MIIQQRLATTIGAFLENKIKRNIILASFYQLVYVFTPLLTTPYISRVLGADGIGDYSFAFSVATFFALFIRLGLNSYGNRTIAAIRDDKDLLSKTFCEIYVMQLACGVIFTGLYILWTVLFAPRIIISICLLLLVMSAVVDITWLLYGAEDFVVTTIRDIIVRLSTVLLIFVFVKTEDDLWKYALINGAGYLVGQLLAWLRISHHLKIVKVEKRGVVSHLKPNLVLFIPSIAVSLYKIMDKIMLGTMTVPNELGFYECSERVINVPMALITALGTVMLPRMSNMVANRADKIQIHSLISKSIVFATFVSSLLCFGIMTVADQFVPLFYGDGYEKCITIYAWLMPSCIFLAFANVLRTQILLPQKRDKEYIASLMTGAAVNIVFNLILIPISGSIGAAIATLVAEGSVWLVQSIEVSKDQAIGMYIFNSMPYVVSGVIMFLLFRSFTVDAEINLFSLIMKIVICGLSYFVILGLCLSVKCILIAIINRFSKKQI